MGTTLVTFMLRAPSAAYSVHLLGSWDNFDKPYPMRKDLQKGTGHWKGCHKFDNILCDGEHEIHAKKRDGGLKMGGKYWYYYRLDGDLEYHDPAQPFTTMCPLLPGQSVNILEVPLELDGHGGKGYDTLAFSPHPIAQTMNPDDKYLTPRPAPIPNLPRLSTSSSSSKPRQNGHLPLRTGILGTYSKSADSSPSSEMSSPLERLLPHHRQLKDGNHRPAKSSPTLSSSALRSAFLGFGHPRSAGPETEVERGRRAFLREDRPMVIGDPVLISRTDEGRHCVPIQSTQSAPASRSLSPSLDFQNQILRPLKSHPVELSERSSTAVPSRSTMMRSRTPSPLRHAVALETCEVADRSTQSTTEASANRMTFEAPCDDRSTQAACENIDPLSTSTRSGSDQAEPNIQAPSCQITVDSLDKCLPDLPSFLTPEPLKLHPRTFECGEESKSHFSIYSTSTIESSPSLSYTSEDPKSPTLSLAFTDPRISWASNHFSSGPATPRFDDFSDEIGRGVCAGFNDFNVANTMDEEPITMEEDTLMPFEGLRIDSAGPRRNAACFGFQKFQGLGLPAEEHGPQTDSDNAFGTNTKVSECALASEPPTEETAFAPWQDITHQSLTAMEELYHDLGYLGGIIT